MNGTIIHGISNGKLTRRFASHYSTKCIFIFPNPKALKPRIVFDLELMGFVYIKTIRFGVDGLEKLI
jgi:hypothetical protein